MGLISLSHGALTEAPGILLIAVVFSTLLLLVRRRARLQRLPPGPESWPVIGSALVLPKEREWLVYQNWTEKHGSDVIYFESWGRPNVVINSHKAASELLEKRSALYSDRPRWPMLVEMVGFGWDFAFMTYDQEWKDTRRVFTQHFRPTAVGRYHGIEINRTHELLVELIERPEEFMELIRLMAGKIIMDIAYGIDVKSADDPFIRIARDALYAMNVAGNVGTYLVDWIPALKYVPDWLPGANFKKQARIWKGYATDMVSAPFKAVKAALRNGSARSSMLTSLLEEAGENVDEYKEKTFGNAAAAAYEGGSETTLAALLTLVLVFLMYPEVQEKAHEEMNRVVGGDRFPEFTDQPSMPYLAAVCKEVLRWRPVLPLAVMHRVTSDDTYQGYHIPAGSTVIVNSWAILHDENVYPNADKFIPERFLTKAGELNPKAPEFPTASFGYGRRSCPGMYMALDSLWMTAACLIWAFNIEKAKDADGNLVEPTGEYTFGLVSYPAPFKCAFVPRSEKILELINTARYHDRS